MGEQRSLDGFHTPPKDFMGRMYEVGNRSCQMSLFKALQWNLKFHNFEAFWEGDAF